MSVQYASAPSEEFTGALKRCRCLRPMKNSRPPEAVNELNELERVRVLLEIAKAQATSDRSRAAIELAERVIGLAHTASACSTGPRAEDIGLAKDIDSLISRVAKYLESERVTQDRKRVIDLAIAILDGARKQVDAGEPIDTVTEAIVNVGGRGIDAPPERWRQAIGAWQGPKPIPRGSAGHRFKTLPNYDWREIVFRLVEGRPPKPGKSANTSELAGYFKRR